MQAPHVLNIDCSESPAFPTSGFLKNNEFNSLRPRRNRHHFAEDIIKCIFLSENELMSLRISLKFVPKGPINNFPALFT